ncbi:hypothetical protein F0562_005958 [Nyssa sinensis]|uniref:Uncharacterized protein n=1 Tax=Nyssa sinensis TaxID=561372 RepID=A0A5J5AM20_9ASTE|nr:hypothetical protein F0562_005958 [Nyssa sinensis]
MGSRLQCECVTVYILCGRGEGNKAADSSGEYKYIIYCVMEVNWTVEGKLRSRLQPKLLEGETEKIEIGNRGWSRENRGRKEKREREKEKGEKGEEREKAGAAGRGSDLAVGLDFGAEVSAAELVGAAGICVFMCIVKRRGREIAAILSGVETLIQSCPCWRGCVNAVGGRIVNGRWVSCSSGDVVVLWGFPVWPVASV